MERDRFRYQPYEPEHRSRMDGEISRDDVLVAVKTFVSLSGFGLTVTGVSHLTGTAWESARQWWIVFTALAALFCTMELVIDALDLLAFWEAYLVHRREMPEQLPVSPGPTIRTTVQVGPGEVRFLDFDEAQSARVLEFSRIYLSLLGSTNYPTAERYYIGSGKPWSNATTGDGGRPGWLAFKRALVENHLAREAPNDRWYLRDSGEFTIREWVRQAEEME